VVCVLQAHSNETVGSLRNKIAKVLKVPAEQIQFLSNEKMVSSRIKVVILLYAACNFCYINLYIRESFEYSINCVFHIYCKLTTTLFCTFFGD